MLLVGMGCAHAVLASPRIEPAQPTPASESATVAPSPSALTPPPVSRGQQLYENHCLACHESGVHIRNRRNARSLPDLRARVGQWAVNLKLNWQREDIDDVTGYLNDRFYQFAPR
jgi:cytochrome c5